MGRQREPAARRRLKEAGVSGLKQAGRDLGLVIAAVAAVAFAAGAWGAGMYKWVDEQGNVHYSDKAPQDVPSKGETVLDKQGRQVEKIDPPLTPAQLKAKAEEDERQRLLTKAKDDQARRDRALILSYSNENEIEIARKRAISTIELQIKSAQAYSEDLTLQQKNIAKQKAGYGSKPIPVELDHQSAAIDAELSRQAILLRQKQEELGMAATKYDTIKQRWREIMSDEERAAAAADAQANPKATKSPPGKPATAPPSAPTASK
jgi:hypothetical protein